MNMYNINSFDEYLKEDNKFDPFLAITYNIQLKILFEGFQYSILNFQLLFPHDEIINTETIKNRIDERLKVFTNICSYKIIKSEEADFKDRILPLY